MYPIYRVHPNNSIIFGFTLTGSKFVSIGPIYYEYGSMVITFDNSESALNALDQLKGSKTEYGGGKKILGESVSQ